MRFPIRTAAAALEVDSLAQAVPASAGLACLPLLALAARFPVVPLLALAARFPVVPLLVALLLAGPLLRAQGPADRLHLQANLARKCKLNRTSAFLRRRMFSFQSNRTSCPSPLAFPTFLNYKTL